MAESRTGEIAEKNARKLTPFDRRKLMRELATGEVKRAQLARDYHVSTPYIAQFAKQHEREIEDIRERLDDEFAGLWIADKQARLAAYEHEYEQAAKGRNSGHHEWVKARTAILRNVAEETGQLPSRNTTAIVIPVTHVVVGVDLDALR